MLLRKLINKAKKSRCRYKVAAVAFNRKGDVLGTAYNVPHLPYKHGGKHPESTLILRYGKKIHHIFVIRVSGKDGQFLHSIKPCKVCQSLADRYRVKIVTVDEKDQCLSPYNF
jgi:hypothetical protein